MPLLVGLAAVVLLVLLAVALTPLSLVLRYRAGTARRQARGWVSALNVGSLAVSVAIFVMLAALTSLWVPRALTYVLGGLAVGFVLGFVGLAATRWERGPGTLHYTPSRLLVLAITLLVSLRILYGLWRSWNVWQSGTGESWVLAFGPAPSMGAGAIVLGYYLSYWSGVRRRFRAAERAR